MAVDSSFLSIINEALDKLGQRPLTAGQLATPDDKASRLVDRSFTNHLEQLVDDHPWHWAITRGQLDVSSGTPSFGYDFEYAYPDGVLYSGLPYCIRFLDAGELRLWGWGWPGFWNGWHQDTSNRWKVEARVLLINQDAPLNVRYLHRPADATNLPPNFKQALSYKLAMEWAEQITATQTLDIKVEQRFERIMNEARASDSQEGIPDPFITQTWLDGRWT